MPAFTIIDALDVIIIAFFIYKLMLIMKGTRATSIIKGLAVVFVANAFARFARLRTVTWVLTQGTTVMLVALPVVFYPELRRALEHLGRGQIFSRLTSLDPQETRQVVEAVVRAVHLMAQGRIGALIVFEREIGLEEYIESGVRLESLISTEILLNIFSPRTPLHDGAVIIRGDRIVAAGSLLPLTDKVTLPTELGTRHRAALGVTEVSDAIVIVVSEETGTISTAIGGILQRGHDDNSLRTTLTNELEKSGSVLKGWTR